MKRIQIAHGTAYTTATFYCFPLRLQMNEVLMTVITRVTSHKAVLTLKVLDFRDTALFMTIRIFGDIAPYRSVFIYPNFGTACYFLLQGSRRSVLSTVRYIPEKFKLQYQVGLKIYFKHSEKRDKNTHIFTLQPVSKFRLKRPKKR